jgi:hypothetical protein
MFQWEINPIRRPPLGSKLVIKTDVHSDEDDGMIAVACINDILIATKGSLEKCQKQLSKVFQHMMDNQMCIEIDKCCFNVSKTTFLGFMVSGSRLRMDPEMARAIVDCPRSTSRNEVQQSIGLQNCYQRSVNKISTMVLPFTEVLQEDRKFEWREAQDAAFGKRMTFVTSGKTPLLRHHDPESQVSLQTDASNMAIAGILSRKLEDGKFHPVQCISITLNPAELNYNV